MQQAGITVDNQMVCKDVFNLVGTHGVPLELILENFKANGRVVDWADYIKAGLKDGANPNTVRSRIESAVGDVYGAQYLDRFKKVLSLYIASI